MTERVQIADRKPETKSENLASKSRNADQSQSMSSPVDQILYLQRTIGNHSVQRLIKSGALQAKLKIGQPGDMYEREADRVADSVMRMPESMLASGGASHIQRACPTCGEEELHRLPIEEEEEELQRQPIEEEKEEEELRRQPVEDEELQAKTTSGSIPEVQPDIESHIQSLKGGGLPLSENDRAFFERRFGRDFNQVRLHTDSRAAEAARAINAFAYTAGNNIVFNAGQSPGKDAFTAHELTHVLQQNRSTGSTAVRVSAIPSSVVQRQCVGNEGSPSGYASRAAPHLQCDEDNTGIRDVTARITAGRRSARVMINDALNLLNRMQNGRASAEALNHFRRLFRLASTGPTPGQISLAIDIYNQICSWLTSSIATSGGGILCLQQGTGQCRSGRVLGSAVCPASGPINLCPDGISSESRVTAETIIHEAAHRFGICTRPPPGAPTGTPPPRELYEGEPGFPTNPALRTSADSYSAFAREARLLMGSERVEAQHRREEESGMVERPVRGRRR